MSDKVFVVVGAQGTIGKLLSTALAGRGRVWLIGRGEQLADHAAKLSMPFSDLDCASFDALKQISDQIVESETKIDGIINCAGSILLKPVHRTSEEEFEKVIASNLKTAFNCIRAVTPHMMSQKSGSIVLISSAAASLGLINHEAIAAAKAGILGLTKSAAATYARHNIRVNCVSPGLIDTVLTAQIINNPASLDASLKMQALKRIGQPQDVIESILWLLSDSSSFVTGQNIGVDGGLGSTKLAF